MAITTATTKNTTPTRSGTGSGPRLSRWGMGALAVFFLLVAVENIFFTARPAADLNLRIERVLPRAAAGKDNKARRDAFARLREEQERNLASLPADPYAWARLSYLRARTGDAPGALDALRMSDLVSPNDPRQIAERALMWHDLRAVHGGGDRTHQAVLWQKAVRFRPGETYRAAARRGLTGAVEAALKRGGDPSLMDAWRAFTKGR